MNLNNSDASLFFAGRQDIPAAIIVPWTTLPGFMLMAGGSLCVLNINARSMGLNAVLAKKQRRGENPAYGLSGHGLSQPFIC
jgi:protein HokE